MMNPRKSEANKPPKLPETTKAHKPRSQLLGPKSCKEQKGKSKKPRSEKAKRHKGHTKATQKPHKSFKKTWATKAKKLPATRLHIPLVVTESLGANCALFIKKNVGKVLPVQNFSFAFSLAMQLQGTQGRRALPRALLPSRRLPAWMPPTRCP